MQCCSISWNGGCCPSHNPNIVSFDNLTTKYSVNEDIHVEYTLHGHVQQASTRDWIGIFPRGWTNLQQYLTFEYTLVAPRAAASSNRAIIFPRVFHQEASTCVEYQLVYVSREIQVLAASSYFRFVRDGGTDAANRALHVPYGVGTSSSEKREIRSDQLASSGWAPPRIVLSDQSLLSIRSSRTIPASPRLPRTCRSCGRPRDGACGLAAGRARFLSTQNASLAERVVRLERDLALSEGTKSSLAERLRSYENFVAEMLRSLAAKRVVKITDASGKEMVLQQLPILADSGVKINQESKKLGNETKQREASHPDRNNPPDKEDLPTNDRDLVGEYLSEDKTNPTKNDREMVQAKGEIDNDRKSEYLVEEKPFSADVETQTRKIDAKWIGDTTKSQNYENTIEVCNDGNRKQAVVEESKTLEASVIDHEEQKEGLEKGGWTDGETEKSSVALNDESKSPQSKPSAIVIQGSNVKFAIIRY